MPIKLPITPRMYVSIGLNTPSPLILFGVIFVNDSSAGVLLLSDTGAERCVCKPMTTAQTDLRVQVGVLRPLGHHLFLRLISLESREY
jgi:hypothetical protein